jgi:hypothetical protein
LEENKVKRQEKRIKEAQAEEDRRKQQAQDKLDH